MFPSRMMLCLEDPKSTDCIEPVAKIARTFGAEVILYYAQRPTFSTGMRITDPRLSAEASALDSLLTHPAWQGVKVTASLGDVPFELVDDLFAEAERSHADLLVMPTHDRSGVDRFMFGSITERVVRSCRFPVLTLDLTRTASLAGAAADFDAVIVPLDFSAISEAALPTAGSIAKRLGCPLHLLHVVEDYYVAAYPMAGVPSVIDFQPTLTETARQYLGRLEVRVRAESGVQVTSSVEVGRLVDQVRVHVDMLRNPLIVMATAGRDSLGDWILGSHAERVMRVGKCSILALPKVFLDAANPAADPKP